MIYLTEAFMKRAIFTFSLVCLVAVCVQAQRPSPDQIPAKNGDITVQPIRHGSVVLNWNGTTIYVDPVQNKEAFQGIDSPDIILITDIHGDHLNMEAINALNTEGTTFVVPQAVADRLSESEYMNQLVILENGKSTEQKGIPIRAIPMYNLPQAEDSRHPKGRGNGYILTLGGKYVYLSGDTEGIPEMRSLTDIDVAFVCMNLPYTMDVNQAADAVLDFEPDIVYPYHYRGQDTQKFKELVNAKNKNIDVRLKNWYPGDEN